MNPEPAFRIHLIGANLTADGFVKNFRTASGYGIQPGFLQQLNARLRAYFGFPEHIIQFYGREGLDMKIRPVGLYFF